MINTIDKHIEIVNEGLNWVNNKLSGTQKEKAHQSLISRRRELNKIKAAIQVDPAVVLYGASQCGKSHLANIILSDEASSLRIVDNDDKGYPFLTHINPQGNGEATGLITRFTIRNVSDINDYPVAVKLMSVKDLVLMLCEGYYNEVTSRNPMNNDSVDAILHNLEVQNLSVHYNILLEDEIWDVKDYFKNYISADMTIVLEQTEFFQRASKFIDKLPIEDLVTVASLLWNQEENMTSLFRKCLQHYASIGFASIVYVKFDSLLNNTAYPNTLLNVSWLDELDKKTIQAEIAYYAPGNALNYTNFDKAYLAVLGAEVVVKVSSDLINTKPFLKEVDILDFPGARGKENAVVIAPSTLPQILRRGKVSYYFNRYTINKGINTLLFCFEPDNFEAKPMGARLQHWIKDAIGATPEAREENIKHFEVSPLFFVGTKFNSMLDYKKSDREDNRISLSERWMKWFDTQLFTSIITPTNDWFDNWTTSSREFKNLYLLRDFSYSTAIFSGWKESRELANGEIVKGEIEKSEIKPDGYPNFRADLKDTFISDNWVQKHFSNPSEAWDDAALVNKDGSERIIRNLSKSAAKIKSARTEKFRDDLKRLIEEVNNDLSKHYHDDSSDENISKAKALAGEAQASLDISFGRDPYFFGKMMQCLILQEGDVYRVFHEMLQTANLVNQKALGKYVYIRMKAPGLSSDNSFEVNLHILAEAYEMTDNQCKEYFESRSIDLEELFSGSDDGMKNISQSLSELLEDYWFNQWLRGEKFKQLESLMDPETLDSILCMLKSLYGKLSMTPYVASSIRKYVDKFGINIDCIEEMIADMCAEILNKFVSTVGYGYLSDDEKRSLMDANEKQDLGLVFPDDSSREQINPLSIANMFEAMDDLEAIKQNSDKDLLRYVPGVVSRTEWSECMKIGFIQVQDIPTYDVEANKMLGVIKEKLLTLNY